MAVGNKRIGLVLVLILIAILTFAWVDGGEEPLHPIEQSVKLPEPAQ